MVPKAVTGRAVGGGVSEAGGRGVPRSAPSMHCGSKRNVGGPTRALLLVPRYDRPFFPTLSPLFPEQPLVYLLSLPASLRFPGVS